VGTIRREIPVKAPASRVWAALRRPGEVADLFPGVLTDSRLDGGDRVVTFANGPTLRERIVAVDDSARRVVYAVLGDQFAHHNASMQVVPDGEDASRMIWITDFLPEVLRPEIEPLIDAGSASFSRRWQVRAYSGSAGATPWGSSAG